MNISHKKVDTTDVIESAYSAVSSKNLSVFHLEGSYAALSALNAERFPLYCKIHGDFRYKKIKNLTEDLLSNDREIQKCFAAAATRYGLIVSGYSGRDENVMSMFRKVIDQNNAFPQGLFWTAPRISEVAESVHDLIAYASLKGVRANLVETGTFDEMLSKVWRQMPGKPQLLDEKVRTARVVSVSIPLPAPGKKYPILRTNPLAVIASPARCGAIDFRETMTFSELKKKIFAESPNAVLTYTDRVLFWGDEEEIFRLFTKEKINSILPFDFVDITKDVAASTILKSFLEEALSKALCSNKPLFLRRSKRKTYFAVVRDDDSEDEIFEGLRNALGYKGQPIPIVGKVNGLKDVTWAEAVSIRLEERGGKLWVMIELDIWIKPLAKRHEARDFLRQRRLKRYNDMSYNLLSAWICILLGTIGNNSSVKVSCFSEAKYSVSFEIGTRTAYSRGVGHG